jgi:multiple sugar transport system permease protein
MLRITPHRPLKTVCVYAVLLGWTVWIGYPLYWLVMTPFKPSARAGSVPFVDFVPTLRSFETTFRPGSDARLALANSLLVSVSAACIALVLGAMAGYALAWFRYRLGPVTNDRLSFFFLAQRLFPVAILSVPYLILFRTLNLLDTPLAIMLGEIGFGTPFVAWLTRDFFASLPRDVEESAAIDGCSRLQVLRHIVFPLAAPGLASAFILIFLGAWNDYVLALVVTFSQSVTLPLYLQAHPNATVALVSVLPPALLGLASQRYLIRGLSFGAAGGATGGLRERGGRRQRRFG